MAIAEMFAFRYRVFTPALFCRAAGRGAGLLSRFAASCRDSEAASPSRLRRAALRVSSMDLRRGRPRCGCPTALTRDGA